MIFAPTKFSHTLPSRRCATHRIASHRIATGGTGEIQFRHFHPTFKVTADPPNFEAKNPRYNGKRDHFGAAWAASAGSWVASTESPPDGDEGGSQPAWAGGSGFMGDGTEASGSVGQFEKVGHSEEEAGRTQAPDVIISDVSFKIDPESAQQIDEARSKIRMALGL